MECPYTRKNKKKQASKKEQTWWLFVVMLCPKGWQGANLMQKHRGDILTHFSIAYYCSWTFFVTLFITFGSWLLRVILVLSYFRRTSTAAGWACACGTECAAEYALFLPPEAAAVTVAVTVAVAVTVGVTAAVAVTVAVTAAAAVAVAVTIAAIAAGAVTATVTLAVVVTVAIAVAAAVLTWRST